MAKMKPDETVHTYLRKQAASGVTYEDVLRMASNFLFRDDELEKKIAVLSGGEKARLGLAGLLLTKYDVLLLDEPTNHLDFETVEGLAFALAECDRTVIFISHDKTFVSIVANKLIHIANNKISQYLGTYQEYVEELTAQVIATTFKQAPKKAKQSEEEIDEEKVLQREAKARMKVIEHELAELQKDEQKLLSEFEKAAGEFNLARTEKFNSVKSEIKKLQKEWEECVAKLEK